MTLLTMRGLWLTALFVLMLACGPRPAWAACQLQSLEIPVRMVGSRPIAIIGLNGQSVPLIVDSGAFFSVLTQSAASQLNLRLRRLPEGMRIYGHTGAMDAKLARVDKVQLKGSETSLEFLVGVNETGAGAMGVLGRNFLSIADTEYDLAHGVVRLIVPKGDCEDTNLAYWAGSAPVNVVPLAPEGREDTAIRVAARVNGLEVKAMLDTGATTTLRLSTARRAGIRDADMTPVGRVGGAGQGHAHTFLAPVALFELGGQKITNNRMWVDDAEGTEPEMYLGIDYFLSHRIYVSRLQKKLYATWNGGPVFDANKSDAADDARYAAAPATVAADDADALARRGAAAAARGDFKRALEDLDRACALAPATAAHFLARAKVHQALDHSPQATADLDEALRLDAALHDARLLRARWRIVDEDRQGALADLQALDATLPPSSHLRSSMANLYANLDLAAESLHQAGLWLSTHPNDAGRGGVLNGRCWLRARLNLDLARALEDCKQAVAEDGDNANHVDSLGWVYLRLGDPQRAVEAFDKAIGLKNAQAFSYYGRGQMYQRLGNAGQAQSDLSEARRLDPKIDAKVKKAGFVVASD